MNKLFQTRWRNHHSRFHRREACQRVSHRCCAKSKKVLEIATEPPVCPSTLETGKEREDSQTEVAVIQVSGTRAWIHLVPVSRKLDERWKGRLMTGLGLVSLVMTRPTAILTGQIEMTEDWFAIWTVP